MATPDGAPTNQNAAQATPPAATWDCKVSGLDENLSPMELPAKLTVGDKFLLSCEGALVQFDKTKLSLEMPKEAQYWLRLLQSRAITDSKAEFIATSWVAGELKIDRASFTDGKTKIALSPMKLDVASVIDPNQKEKPEPFAPWTPLYLAWPVWVWLSFAIVFAAIVAAIVWRVRVVLRRKKFLKLLSDNQIALSPYNHFNKDLRKLTRLIPLSGQWTDEESKGYFTELDQQVRWFLARELRLPVFGMSAKAIVSSLRKSQRAIYEMNARDLNVLMTELEKSHLSGGSVQDAQQLTELARVVVDRIHKVREGAKK